MVKPGGQQSSATVNVNNTSDNNGRGCESPMTENRSEARKPKYITMRLCVYQADAKKILAPDLWPFGVTVRPWVFKTGLEQHGNLYSCMSIAFHWILHIILSNNPVGQWLASEFCLLTAMVTTWTKITRPRLQFGYSVILIPSER